MIDTGTSFFMCDECPACEGVDYRLRITKEGGYDPQREYLFVGAMNIYGGTVNFDSNGSNNYGFSGSNLNLYGGHCVSNAIYANTVTVKGGNLNASGIEATITDGTNALSLVTVALLLCIALCAFVLSACVKRAAEEQTRPTTEITQPEGAEGLEEGELPAITIPVQTEPMTEPAGGTEPPADTTPTEGTNPPAATEPAESTELTEPAPTQSESTEPPETMPAETTEQSELEEDELPPIPL